MITKLKTWMKDRSQRQQIMDFLDEMDKNLELFYVMDQRQFITSMFSLKYWPRVKDVPLIAKHESVRHYASALQKFNQDYEEHKKFESWYSGDMNHKTPDNAKKLHAQKQDLEAQLRKLEAVIIPAGQDIEREMVALGYLKA